VFSFHNLSLQSPNSFGMGTITGNVPTFLLRGVHYSCYQVESTMLISLSTLIIVLKTEKLGRFLYLSGLTKGLGVLYERKFLNYIDISPSRNNLSLVDIIIDPVQSSIIRVVSFDGPKVLSVDLWNDCFINIAVLDLGLVSVKKPEENR